MAKITGVVQVAFVTQSLESLADICTTLVSYGCHIYGYSVSPLRLAVDQNSPSIVAALLSARLKFPDTVQQALAKLDSRTGRAPLHTAIRYGYLECAQLLLDAGADVNAVCQGMFGECVATPLELAVMTHNKDAVLMLLQSPSCQVDKMGSRKSTALLHAIARGSIVIVILHLKNMTCLVFIITLICLYQGFSTCSPQEPQQAARDLQAS